MRICASEEDRDKDVLWTTKYVEGKMKNRNDCFKTVKVGMTSHFESQLPRLGTGSASRLVIAGLWSKSGRMTKRLKGNSRGRDSHSGAHPARRSMCRLNIIYRLMQISCLPWRWTASDTHTVFGVAINRFLIYIYSIWLF
jgi:hypothetical protein